MQGLTAIGGTLLQEDAAKVLEEIMPTSIPPGVFGLLGLITTQIFFCHILCCLYWAAEHEWPAPDAVGSWAVGDSGGCYRVPRISIGSDVYAGLGKGDAGKPSKHALYPPFTTNSLACSLACSLDCWGTLT